MPELYSFEDNQHSQGTDLQAIFPIIGSSSTPYPKYYSTSGYLYDLNSDKYSLKEIVDVNVNEEEDCFRAENDSLNVWATGNSSKEALSNLKKEIIYLYEELEEAGENGLGPKPLEWWTLLKSIIVKNEISRASRNTE